MLLMTPNKDGIREACLYEFGKHDFITLVVN